MQNLYQIYEKFLTLFSFSFNTKKRSEKSNLNDVSNQDHSASLFFGLLDSDPDIVDIKCLLPNVDDKNTSEITSIAEKYAQLLVLLNSETFNKNIHEILDMHKTNNSENFKTIMLVDSIISFWDILYNLQTKQMYTKYKAYQPLIKPSEAFRLK
jgi:hypothetical protein